MGGEGPNKREHQRFLMDVVVEVETESGLLFSGRSRNISRGGLCLEVPHSVDRGDEVQARIALIFHDQHISEPLALPARVVWSTPLGDSHQVGCKFGALSEEQSAYLNLFLSYIEAASRAAAPVAEDWTGNS